MKQKKRWFVRGHFSAGPAPMSLCLPFSFVSSSACPQGSCRSGLREHWVTEHELPNVHHQGGVCPCGSC